MKALVMARSTFVRLTLLFSAALEERLVEFMLAQTPPLPGFTVLRGEGHGEAFINASVREQVLGRLDRRLLVMILSDERCDPLIQTLAEAFQGTDLVLWTEAISGYRELT